MTDADRTSTPPPGAPPQRARLHIDGVRSPVLARVARRRESGMTCVQELPFLRIESAVTDDRGRRARIARVALAVENDVPKLVIELAYDDHDDDFPSNPPAVPYGAIVVASPEALDTIPGAPAPELHRLVFRADPIESLREPPVTFAALARAWWNEIVDTMHGLETALETSVRRALSQPARRLA